jgi:hypothetical protein
VNDHPLGPPHSVLRPRSQELATEPLSIEQIAEKFLALLDYLGVSWSEDVQAFVPNAQMPPRSSQQGPENVEPVVTAGP